MGLDLLKRSNQQFTAGFPLRGDLVRKRVAQLAKSLDLARKNQYIQKQNSKLGILLVSRGLGALRNALHKGIV